MTSSSEWLHRRYRTVVDLILNHGLRKNPWLTWVLFRVKIRDGQRIHWDFTSLALKYCLRRLDYSPQQVLEMGTGPYALLSIYLAKRFTTEITACDVNSEYVRQAQQVILLNKTKVSVRQSELFSNVPQSFDLIFFNSVYIPRPLGEKYGINMLHERETDWCGGEDGTETMARFLRDAVGHLKDDGKIILGFNPRYLHEAEVVKLCSKNNLTILSRCSVFYNPSLVLIIERSTV